MMSLSGERKVLGYYLSSHPINEYKKELTEMKLKRYFANQ